MSIKVNKSKLNLSIDVIMFMVLMAIAGIGFMIKYVLVPGFKRNEIYGNDVDLYFMGLDRHQWGTIHLILSFILLFLLLLHIFFHWNMIISVFKRMVLKRSLRIALATSFIVLSFIFGVTPLFLKPEIRQGTSHQFHQTEHVARNNLQGATSSSRQKIKQTEGEAKDTMALLISKVEQSDSKSYQKENYKQNEKHTIEVHGYMTLNEVAEIYDITPKELASCIHIPIEYSNEKLGRLRKKYNFQMEDLRNYIELKTNKND